IVGRDRPLKTLTECTRSKQLHFCKRFRLRAPVSRERITDAKDSSWFHQTPAGMSDRTCTHIATHSVADAIDGSELQPRLRTAPEVAISKAEMGMSLIVRFDD